MGPIIRTKYTDQIKNFILENGFDAVGISKVEKLESEAKILESWLNSNSHGNMAYMENHFEERINPERLLPGSRSIISVLKNYYPGEKYSPNSNPIKLSRYAVGTDYHIVVKNQLQIVQNYLNKIFPDCITGIYVDSAPIMDKVWAKKSGLGWIGRNTNLIRPGQGSYYFIGEILIDVVLDYSQETKDYCGTCKKCIEACPTNALTPYKIDATKCISYWTIEDKKFEIEKNRHKLENWAFGCDICQEVCPWNKFSLENNEPLFAPLPFISNTVKEWEGFTNRSYKKLTKLSPISRIKYEKWLSLIKKNES